MCAKTFLRRSSQACCTRPMNHVRETNRINRLRYTGGRKVLACDVSSQVRFASARNPCLEFSPETLINLAVWKDCRKFILKEPLYRALTQCKPVFIKSLIVHTVHRSPGFV